MEQFKNIRQDIVKINTRQYEVIEKMRRIYPRNLRIQAQANYPDLSPDEAYYQLELEMHSFAIAAVTAKQSKSILFSAEQADVFLESLAKKEVVSLDYTLPFQDVWLQFTRPVTINTEHRYEIAGFLLTQIEANRDTFQETVRNMRAVDAMDGTRSAFMDVDWGNSSTLIFNTVIGVLPTCYPIRTAWNSSREQIMTVDPDGTMVEYQGPFLHRMRALAIACIGYINCENIYLHKEGEVPDKVNRKREREGKKILEPYYVCRIRGVQYDSNGEPTGEGTHHGFRYDVRGHFRRLESGKTTWVRPHQRGLLHELYIPKTYVVEKGAKTPA